MIAFCELEQDYSFLQNKFKKKTIIDMLLSKKSKHDPVDGVRSGKKANAQTRVIREPKKRAKRTFSIMDTVQSVNNLTDTSQEDPAPKRVRSTRGNLTANQRYLQVSESLSK